MADWSEVDEWAAGATKAFWESSPDERREMLRIGAKTAISTDRARTLRAQRRIDRGFHPFGMRLLGLDGAKCGNCRFQYERRFAKTYFKCELVEGTGPGSDLRKSWPPCEKWQPKEAGDAWAVAAVIDFARGDGLALIRGHETDPDSISVLGDWLEARGVHRAFAAEIALVAEQAKASVANG